MDQPTFFIQFVDLLMPELTPHEASMYMFLFRHSWIANGTAQVRIGQRTIAQKYGRGPKMSVPSRAHIIRQVEELERKGCIKVFDTTREGTLYEVVLPEEIPLVREKIFSSSSSVEQIEDYYHDQEKRTLIYERDKWLCQYCGERVSKENATVDHFIPQCNDGTHEKENLRTACLMCNSVKSGKTYEEAAMLLLKSIQDRRTRNNSDA